jgi:hypothetical protein
MPVILNKYRPKAGLLVTYLTRVILSKERHKAGLLVTARTLMLLSKEYQFKVGHQAMFKMVKESLRQTPSSILLQM